MDAYWQKMCLKLLEAITVRNQSVIVAISGAAHATLGVFWCVGWLYRNASAETPSLLMLLHLEHMDLILVSFCKEAAPVKAQVEKL